MTLKKASGDRVEESLRTERQKVGRDEWLLRLKVDCDSPHGVDSDESLTMH